MWSNRKFLSIILAPELLHLSPSLPHFLAEVTLCWWWWWWWCSDVSKNELGWAACQLVLSPLPRNCPPLHIFCASSTPHSIELVQSTVYILSWQKSHEMITSIGIRRSLLSNVQNKIPEQKKKFQFPLPPPQSTRALPLELVLWTEPPQVRDKNEWTQNVPQLWIYSLAHPATYP